VHQHSIMAMNPAADASGVWDQPLSGSIPCTAVLQRSCVCIMRVHLSDRCMSHIDGGIGARLVGPNVKLDSRRPQVGEGQTLHHYNCLAAGKPAAL
jgi:hypothetical protein